MSDFEVVIVIGSWSCVVQGPALDVLLTATRPGLKPLDPSQIRVFLLVSLVHGCTCRCTISAALIRAVERNLRWEDIVYMAGISNALQFLYRNSTLYE